MLKSVNILLIEDDEDDYILTRDSLNDLTFIVANIDWADSAQDGLQKLTQQSYDLCLLDYQLGGLTGIEVLRQAQERPLETPVIMLTGQAQDEAVNAALKAGATDYLLKAEVPTSRFARAIRYALARGEMQAERIERSKVESESRAKDRFLAHLSHELRTPLTSIIGYTEMLLNGDKAESVRNELQVVLRNGEYLLTLLNDVLDLSKISAQKLELDIIRCHLPELIKEVLALAKTLASAKDLSLKVDVSKPLPEYIDTDPKRLRQILINLLGNAIKFTHEGHITLSIGIRYHEQTPELKFSVIDTGVGIDDDDQKKIFQPFTQLDEMLNKASAGTGLGLAISRQLVKKMGGEIEVESTVGVGSCFSFTIDVGKLNVDEFTLLDLEGELQPYQTHKIEQYQGRVLVVDDLKDIRHLMAQHLTNFGLNVEQAENGKVAVDKVQAQVQQGTPFDIVFMDLHMPVLDGYQSVQLIRENGYNGPIVALTAAARKGLGEELEGIGFTHTLAKPINLQSLRQCLSVMLTDGQSNKSNGQKRILLVEDDVDAAQATQMMLESLGASVDVAHDGAQCLSLIAEKAQWDIVLLDLNLPDMKGLQLSKQLHQHDDSLDIYILSGEQPDESILLTHPVKALLQKPLFLADLTRLLQ